MQILITLLFQLSCLLFHIYYLFCEFPLLQKLLQVFRVGIVIYQNSTDIIDIIPKTNDAIPIPDLFVFSSIIYLLLPLFLSLKFLSLFLIHLLLIHFQKLYISYFLYIVLLVTYLYNSMNYNIS